MAILTFKNAIASSRSSSQDHFPSGDATMPEKSAPEPSAKSLLLSIARRSIQSSLMGERFDPVINDDELLAPQGAFVTLTQKGRLRGCIGAVESRDPLYKTVAAMAVQAALDDPRFPPLTLEELPKTHIEISLLSPLQRISKIQAIKMGTHGVMLHISGRRGLYLPQVGTQTGWNVETFLSNICSEKMGLPGDAWKRPEAEIYTFTVESIEEARPI